MARRQVVLGTLGVQLDSGTGPARWEKWRPTVSLGQHEHWQLDRLDLLLDERRYSKLADVVAEDLLHASPQTELRRHDLYLADP